MSEERWGKITPYTPPDINYIMSEMEKYETLLEQFCKASKLDRNRVKVNIQSLKDVIIRVDMRKLYFRVFHANMEPNEYKRIIGLSGFWILKLRPFWIQTEDNDSEEILRLATWLNEEIVLHMVCGLLKEYNPEFFETGHDLCESYCSELLYSFRYRDLSKEAMFLLFDPFYFSALRNTLINSDGKILL